MASTLTIVKSFNDTDDKENIVNPSQRYLSTRGGSHGLSFENTVLKGLASDGGLFIPEEIPYLPQDWESKWENISFLDLAFEILSLYISPSEVPTSDLRDIISRSYSSFRVPDITPLVTLDEQKKLHLLELFHGPTFAFKDVALQFLGNLFEYFITRKNRGKQGKERYHLTVVGATSGDTGSAAIYGLRGKKDVSVFILYPKDRVSPIQEAQMTTVLDPNVHNLAVQGTFDDCQDIVKALFADSEINKNLDLGAVNSINWARILAQITYYFQAYFLLKNSHVFKSGDKIRFVVPTGNFGDILAGYYAKRMGLPIDKLVIATNENDILDRFWKSGKYEKMVVSSANAQGGIPSDGAKAHEGGVKETLSPAMDILVSSNFERLLWLMVYESKPKTQNCDDDIKKHACSDVKVWLEALKINGGFQVPDNILNIAKKDFESQKISDPQTLETIKDFYSPATKNQDRKSYILDPHSAIGIAASLLSIECNSTNEIHHIALATAHPAKFAHAVEMALQHEKDFDFKSVLPLQFVGLEEKEKRVQIVPRDAELESIRTIIEQGIQAELGY
ncbi:putative threonine synthase [Erysiphe necator]|uniref:threonine synthase n=1 Tax=Uncinula necator TaxID=52586 RepID=A0A0B1PB49_UNCNE|nr:putative threonine synthase [Erysiphe necator]